METARSKLTVFFEPPFWVGVFEREQGGQYAACKIVFGAEPRECEVYRMVLERYARLEFSPALAVPRSAERRLNPKRSQRQARQQTRQAGAGTKAQQALQMQREEGKLQRKRLSREAREAEQERRFLLRQEKRREKHKGR